MRSLVLILILLFAAACSSEASPTATVEATRIPNTALPMPSPTDSPTTSPSATPMPVEDLPAIELLTGEAETCTIAEDYSIVVGFEVTYYETTTANRVHYRLEDAEGNSLTESDTTGENKDGEEGWGFYPLAYTVPENSSLTMTIEVYESEAENAALTSRSSLTYNCTTGETIRQSFERMGQ